MTQGPYPDPRQSHPSCHSLPGRRLVAFMILLSALAVLGAGAGHAQDSTAPALSGAVVNGSTVTLTYDRDLDAGARPQAAAFGVWVDGADRQVVGVDVFGTAVTLTLQTPVSAGDAVTVGYLPPANRALQDTEGSRAEGFADRAVTNRTPADAPRLWRARVEGSGVVLIFSRLLDAGSEPSGGDFHVTAAAAGAFRDIAVDAVSVDGPRVVLDLAVPVADDEAVLVSYSPGDSPIRSSDGHAAPAVRHRPVTVETAPAITLARLAVTGADQAVPRAIYPPFHPDTHHYAMRCTDRDEITLMASKEVGRTSLTVNGRSFSGLDSQHRIGGLSVDSDVVITVGDLGRSATYVVHCLPEHFPYVTTSVGAGASDSLVTFSVSARNAANQTVYFYGILDNNGVPRFHRENEGRVVHFRPHPDGAYPYAFLEVSGVIPRPSGYNRPQTYEAVILDEDFVEVDRATTTPDILHTDPHDFIIKENGDYVLLAYETAYRDLSHLLKPDGANWGDNVPVDDSIIQVVTPGTQPTPDGDSVLLWNSIDHMALEDCQQHFFPHDYAHVNSLQVLDNGDIVASFRGCSQVYLIDGETGEVIWKVGRSNRTTPEWTENLLTVTGDPHGEFCGQHAANLLDNGNLILFDNGTACQVDNVTFASQRTSSQFSRVVEYSIDTANNQAVFVRDHSFRNGYDTWSSSAGLVAPLENGNWLISWGSMRTLDNNLNTAPPPGETLTEVDPDTNREVFSLRMTSRGELLTTRAYRIPYEWVSHRTVDTTAPVVTTATVDGETLVLTFDEDLDASSSPAAGDLTVTVDGSPAALTGTAEVAGQTVTLTLQDPTSGGEAVTVAYGGTALQDTAADPNPVASFGPVKATNTTNLFSDTAGSTFTAEIIWVTAQGITKGCATDRYCPDQPVTRGEMASLLARALNLPATDTDHFTDDTHSTHQDNINRLAQTNITLGCTTDRYCPDQPVTRGEMASLLARALNLPATDTDHFTDDTHSTHQDNINRLAQTNITLGCTTDRYCPDQPVTRGQMAALLYRARDLLGRP